MARWVAWKVLDGILRLLHPFMPFVTEEIWQALPHDGELLATADWPRAKKAWFDAEAEREVALLQDLVVAVRNLRAENNLPPGKRVPITVRGRGGAARDGGAPRAAAARAGARRTRCTSRAMARGPRSRPRRWCAASRSSCRSRAWWI